MPPTVACRRQCRAGVPHQARRSPPPDVCGGPVRRSCPRRFRRVRRGRGPRVTWAGMARSPRRLPRRPADSPALPLQHTQRDSRPLMFRSRSLWSAYWTRAFHFQLLLLLFERWRPAAPEIKIYSKRVFGYWGERPKERPRFTAIYSWENNFIILIICVLCNLFVLRNIKLCDIQCKPRKNIENLEAVEIQYLSLLLSEELRKYQRLSKI